MNMYYRITGFVTYNNSEFEVESVEERLEQEGIAVDIFPGTYYRVPCDKRGLNYDSYFSKGDAARNTLTEFNSNNTKLLTVEETKATIAKLAYIQERLAEE